MDINKLVNQFLGEGSTLPQQAKNMAQKATSGSFGGFAGGAAAGGVLGLLLGNKKARKMAGNLAGGVVGYGGAAVLGAMAFKAYQNWQGKKAATPLTEQDIQQTQQSGQKFLPDYSQTNDGQPFGLLLVKAMIAAANADGHMDATEQQRIFAEVEKLELPPASKATIFEAMAKPPSFVSLASAVNGQEQAAELYLASRLAIDPDQPAEQAYLRALATQLQLPPELVQHLEQQINAA